MSDNAPLSPAEQLANNITALHLNGHSGMDVSTQVALASSGEQPNVMFAIADKIKQATAQTSAGIQSFFYDAQQARVPSVTQQLATTLTGHAPTVLYEDHVSKIQQDLINQGFAPKGTPITGIWGPEWTQVASAARYANLTKPGTGNAPAKSTVQHILGALSLSRNANALLQAVKALPRETLQAIGDLVSGHSMITNPLVKSDSFVGAGRAIAQLGAKPENRTSNAEFAKRAESGSQAFQDLMSVLTFLPMGQVAEGIKFAGAELKAGTLAADVVKPKYTLLNSIVAAEKAGMPSLLTATSAKAFANKPILKQIYWGVDHAINTLSPAIAKTAPIQIFVRDNFAKRLRLPVFRAGNKLGFAVIGAGLKEQAIALAESKTGGKDGVLDSTVYGVAPISGFMANALDIFSAQMNPASFLGKTGAVAGILGDTKKSTDAFRNALDDMGALRAWQRANPKLDYHAVIADHVANVVGGSELDVLKEIGQQINQMSVDRAVRELKNPLLTDGTWAVMSAPEKEAWAKTANNQIYADAANPNGLLQAARTTLVADQNAMETGFADIGVGIAEDVRAGSKARKGTSSFNQKLQANVAMESLLNSDLAKYFVSPATLKTFKAMAKDIADQTALEESDLALGQGTGEVTRIKAPKIDSQFVENTHIQNTLGSIGMARLDTLTNAGGIKMLNQFREELTNVGKGAAYQKLRTKIAQSLIDEFGVDVEKLTDKDASDLLGEFEKQVDGLAHDLRIVRDAPPEVQALIAQMKDAGYKPVIGTDIGHVFNKAAQFTDLGAADFVGPASLQIISKVARAIGISPHLSTSAAISARSAVELRRSVQAGIDSGKIEVLPSFNADRLITYLRNTLESQTELTVGQKAVMGASKEAGNYDIAIQKIITAAAKENKVVTKEEAWNMIKAAKRTELGLREIDPRDLMAVLTKPMDKDVAELMGLPKGSAFMDEQSARNTIHAIWRARVKVPSEMIGGVAKLEDILYSGFYFGNRSIGKNTMKLMAIPSTLMNFRSRVRYQESVVFAFRRMFKTMAKGITENIPPVLYADAKMTDMGIAEEAARIHARIYPKDAAKASFLDDAERIVKEADFYNLYNPVASEQWAAYWLAKQGFSDTEIAQKIENVMGYGERTAAERSLNAIFFPFSFNKTVMRQFGKFLLTNPGQRVLVSGMINLYDQLNGPELKKWLDENAPLIKQLEAMNALEHGVGLGGFGGINAPYIQGVKDIMTVLGPKAIHYGAPSKNDPILVTLAKYVPMVKEFNDLFLKPQDAGHLFEGQVQTTLKTVLSVKDRIGSGESFFNPKRHTLMGFQAQQTAAWDYRTQLITGLTPILDNNYKNPNFKKVWPDWIPVEVGIRGLPINKATIGQLVHYKYPAWDNAASAVISAQKATETNRFIGEVTARDKELGALYRGFDNAAKKVSDGVAKDSIAAPKLVILTDGFRQIAIQLAKQDANFAGFYKTHYERTFGPLEGLTNG